MPVSSGKRGNTGRPRGSSFIGRPVRCDFSKARAYSASSRCSAIDKPVVCGMRGGRSPGAAAGSNFGVSRSAANTEGRTTGFSGGGTTHCVPQSGQTICWPT